MAPQPVEIKDDAVDERLKDKRFDYGSTAFYEKIAEDLTVKLPKALNSLEAKMKDAYYSQITKKGQEDIKGLAKTISDAKTQYLADFFGWSASKEEGKEELEAVLEEYAPFDENKVQADLEKGLEKMGYIDNRIVENSIGYTARNFHNRRQRHRVTMLTKKIESSPKEWKEFGAYLVSLGKDIGIEVKLDELINTDKRIEKFIEMIEQRQASGKALKK